MATAFIITGDPTKHGSQPPVVVFSDGVNTVLVNPATLRMADVKQFALQTDATTAATNIVGVRVIQIDTANPDLVGQVRNPSVVVAAGR